MSDSGNGGNMKLCNGCTKCCEHVALEIDVPQNAEDYQEIIWFVLHDKVSVWIDYDGKWYIEFQAKCSALGDNKCRIYSKRPNICREYSSEDCVHFGEGEANAHMFNTREDVLAYLEKKKPNIWRQIK